MSTLSEAQGEVTLDWNAHLGSAEDLQHYTLRADKDGFSLVATVGGRHFAVYAALPSAAVTGKLAELFDRVAELRSGINVYDEPTYRVAIDESMGSVRWYIVVNVQQGEVVGRFRDQAKAANYCLDLNSQRNAEVYEPSDDGHSTDLA